MIYDVSIKMEFPTLSKTPIFTALSSNWEKEFFNRMVFFIGLDEPKMSHN